MKLDNYISDLLYRYECVIVPEFGGFVANSKSAVIDKASNTLQPPYKQLTFNSHLTNNDGLLANYIVSIDKIPYKCALNFIQFEVENWLKQLNNEDLNLENLGTLSKLKGKIHFEPQQKTNFLTSSFGLGNVVIREIKREEYKKQVEKIEEKAPVLFTEESKKAPNYLKYAAIFVLGLSVLGFGGKFYNNYQLNKQVVEAKKQQNIIDKKIESATFNITKPLPTLNLKVNRAKMNFHIIAGAFRVPENATKKVQQLIQDGYKAKILGINKWNLSIVSFGSFSSREAAYKELIKYKTNVDKDAWLLIQEF